MSWAVIHASATRSERQHWPMASATRSALLVVVACVTFSSCGSREFEGKDLVGKFRTVVQNDSTAEILELKPDYTYHHSFAHEGMVLFSRTGTWKLINESRKIPEFPHPVDAHIELGAWRDVDYYREVSVTAEGQLIPPLDTIAPVKQIRNLRIWNENELWRYLEGDYSFRRVDRSDDASDF